MKEYQADTLCSQEADNSESQNSHTIPLFASSAFVMKSLEESIQIFKGEKDGFVYSRYGNPNSTATAEKIASLETLGLNMKSHAFMTSSGMAAISAALHSTIKPRGAIVTHHGLYGATTELIEMICAENDLTLIYHDLNSLDEIKKLHDKKNICCFYLETPANPLLNGVNVKAVSELAQSINAYVIVDNTFATPILQQPFALGADIIVHSTTKYLSGHGHSIAGAIVLKDANLISKAEKYIRLNGTHASPFESWLVFHGIKTLALRIEKQVDNAMKVFHYLSGHPSVKKIYYSGDIDNVDYQLFRFQLKRPVPLLSFEINGNFNKVVQFFDNIKLIKHVPTLGDLNTICLHPDSSSHRNISAEIKLKLGINPQLIRLSIGIENIGDIIEDLSRGLKFEN